MFIQILRRQHEIDRRIAFVQFPQAEVRRTQGALHGDTVQPFGVRDRCRDHIARCVLARLQHACRTRLREAAHLRHFFERRPVRMDQQAAYGREIAFVIADGLRDQDIVDQSADQRPRRIVEEGILRIRAWHDQRISDQPDPSRRNPRPEGPTRPAD